MISNEEKECKKYVVKLEEAISGVLHGGAGVFRLLLDVENCGARNFSLMVNTMKAGVKGDEHKHDNTEHAWYILKGTGTYYLDGKPYRIGPDMAVFAPANAYHKIDVDPDEDLTYVLIYAPPGPEQKLKKYGAHAFDTDKK